MKILRSLFMLCGLFLPFTAWAADAPKTYTLAALPQSPPVEMHRNWTPFVKALSEKTGLVFKLKVYEVMRDFEKDATEGSPDFIFATPPQIAMAHEIQGYVPLIRSSQNFGGVMFVRKDSPIKSAKDLEGKTIAFVGSKNVCAVFTRHVAGEQEGLLNFQPLYAGSTDNTFKTVLLGKADAGATLDVAFGKAPEEISSNLRTILTTPQIASHPIAAHPRVPEAERARITAAIEALGQSADGPGLFKAIRMPLPLVRPDYDKDYKHLEGLQAKEFPGQKM